MSCIHPYPTLVSLHMYCSYLLLSKGPAGNLAAAELYMDGVCVQLPLLLCVPDIGCGGSTD